MEAQCWVEEGNRGALPPMDRVARAGVHAGIALGEHALVVHAAILGEQDIDLDGPIAAVALARIHESARVNSPVSTARPR